jgi:hypothetical protein
MADLNKQENKRKKRVYRRKIKSVSINNADKDSERLTDSDGRLKFIKQSKYLKTLTQGEE